MNQINEKEMLYIPLGLKTEPEIFPGFGGREFRQVVVFVIIGGIVDLLIYLLTKSLPITIFLFLGIAFASVMFTIKDPNTHLSVINQVQIMFRYISSQKRYDYTPLHEWNQLRK